MDKGTARLTESIANGDAAEAIEREIESIRQNLDALVSELDHRRHQLNPAVLVRRHPLVLAAVGVLLAGVAVAGVSLVRSRRRSERSWRVRGKRLGLAIGRLVHDPESVAPAPPALGKRILVAGASAAAAVLARRLARRLMRPAP